MTKSEYIDADPAYVSACARRTRAYEALSKGDRWGDTRRFSGRSAGLRLEAIERANKACSRAYDAAEKRWNRIKLYSTPELNLSSA